MEEPTAGVPVTSVQWIHSARKTTDEIDVVVVKEKIVTALDGKIIDSRNNLRCIPNPKRRFWVTKPQFRNHTYKKETEFKDRCDEYRVEDKDLVKKLKEVMGLPKYARIGLREICNSPYIYGADVPVENQIRMKYLARAKHPLVKYSIGSLDIEKSVLGCDRINLITFVHEREVYCSILDDFVYKYRNNKRVKATIEDVKKRVEELIGETLKKYGFNLTLAIHPDEMSLMKWLFSNIHKHETDFVGIWNMDYDISRIMERINYYNEDPEDIFCPQSLPKALRMARYKQDMRNTAHITDKWHWVFCTGHTQYLDKMNLYARNRKGKSKLSSYKFDDVAKAELKMGKLVIGEDEDGDHGLDWHRKMQEFDFLGYIAYNIIDAVVLQLHEETCNDIQAMMGLIDVSHPFEYSKQTNMLRDTETVYCEKYGRVFATVGKEMEGPYDQLLGKAGGTVLRTEKVTGVGLFALEERPHTETRCIVMVGDNDYGSVYPTMKIINGIDKETKLYTVITIEGMNKAAVEDLFSCISSPKENAVYVCQKFFNLPGYEEINQMFNDHLTSNSRVAIYETNVMQ